jgi:hypothetical protein
MHLSAMRSIGRIRVRSRSNSIRALFITGIAVCAVAGTLATAKAQTPALTFTTSPTSSGGFVLGWQFSVKPAASVIVSALGYYDFNQDGLSQAHTVGIYDSVGTLLVSAVVPTGTAGTLVNQYRYISITPFTLAAGGAYTIEGTNTGTGDRWAFGDGTETGLTVNSNLTKAATNAAVFANNGGATLVFTTTKPNSPTGYSFLGGPNFQISGTIPSGVPEPGAAAIIIGITTTGAVLTMRRRKVRN